MHGLERHLNTHDLRDAARRRLPRGVFEYVDRGTEDELALEAARHSLASLRFRPRVLTGGPEPVLATTVLGRELAAPLIVAPTAFAGLMARDGEIALARAAACRGLPYALSTQSITPVEAVRAAVPEADLWLQLYVWRDRALSWALLDRAAARGVRTLLVTADTVVPPNREHNVRNGFGMPFRWNLRAVGDVARRPGWVWRVLGPALLRGRMPEYGNYPDGLRPSLTRGVADPRVQLDTRLDWADLREIRRRWPGAVLLKGVLHPDDARRAAAEGLDGVIVSTHGGRNLDSAVTTASALPEIAASVGGQIAVLADSGVRRGSDVLKYIALGATAVLAGRVPLWGVAAGGEAGAGRALDILLAEMRTAMGFLGIARPDEARALLAGGAA